MLQAECPSQHDHWTCPIHKADKEGYRKVHGTKKHTPDNGREIRVEVSKGALSKMMIVAKEIQEIRRARAPKQDKNKDKDTKG